MFKLGELIIERAQRREPDFIIGTKEVPYLRRWWIIPRNKVFNIYLHQFILDDDDRALHDHPWLSLSWLIRGALVETILFSRTPGGKFMTTERAINAGDWIWRSSTHAHRLCVPDSLRGKTWTLFMTGPVLRGWGFHCPKGWVPWHEFVDDRDKGRVGAGCGD